MTVPMLCQCWIFLESVPVLVGDVCACKASNLGDNADWLNSNSKLGAFPDWGRSADLFWLFKWHAILAST